MRTLSSRTIANAAQKALNNAASPPRVGTHSASPRVGTAAAKPRRTVFITSQLSDWHIRQQCRTRRVRY
jgi:hypothetical protein